MQSLTGGRALLMRGGTSSSGQRLTEIDVSWSVHACAVNCPSAHKVAQRGLEERAATSDWLGQIFSVHTARVFLCTAACLRGVANNADVPQSLCQHSARLQTGLALVVLVQQRLDIGALLLLLPGSSWDLALPVRVSISSTGKHVGRVRCGGGWRCGPAWKRTEVAGMGHCCRSSPVYPVTPPAEIRRSKGEKEVANGDCPTRDRSNKTYWRDLP